MVIEGTQELVERISLSTSLPVGTASRLLDEIASYFFEPVNDFVRRRHGEFRAIGLTNAEIFPRIAGELIERPFAAPPLSERQLRRIVYG